MILQSFFGTVSPVCSCFRATQCVHVRPCQAMSGHVCVQLVLQTLDPFLLCLAFERGFIRESPVMGSDPSDAMKISTKHQQNMKKTETSTNSCLKQGFHVHVRIHHLGHLVIKYAVTSPHTTDLSTRNGMKSLRSTDLDLKNV